METDKTKIRFLIEQLSRKDSEKALEHLFKAYYPQLIRYLFLLVRDRNTAEELLSDVFLAVWKNRKNIRFPDSFDTYLYRISKYKALNYLKSIKDDTVNIDDISFSLFDQTISVTPEQIMISDQSVESINRLIDKLPAKCKMAFKLVREDKLGYKQAAEIMDVSINTIDAHIYRAVKIIKEELEKQIP